MAWRGEFDPHGQAVLETGTTTLNSRKFTGYERDWATGLDYARARMYQSSRGRFTSPDPAGMSSADKRVPESFNRYAYAGNDPVNHVDPGGEDWFDLIFQFASVCYSQGSDGWRLGYDVLNDTYEVFCDGRRAREMLTKAVLIALGEWSQSKRFPRPKFSCAVMLGARKTAFPSDNPKEPSLDQFYHTFIVLTQLVDWGDGFESAVIPSVVWHGGPDYNRFVAMFEISNLT